MAQFHKILCFALFPILELNMPFTRAQERKRKTVIRDWWKMVLWYVRLRRAAKTGVIHEDLLKIERMSRPELSNRNVIGLVRSATLSQ